MFFCLIMVSVFICLSICGTILNKRFVLEGGYMLLKDIADKFCSRFKLEGELEFLGKVAICVLITEWSRYKYKGYLAWESVNSHYSNHTSVFVRVFESKGVGRLAECVGVYGMCSLDTMFSDICLEKDIINPCGEIGLLSSSRKWLEDNEDEWLSLAEGFVLIEG